MYTKTYLNWMENIHDWCISRQLWWGHRIPAWHCAACHKITVPRFEDARTDLRPLRLGSDFAGDRRARHLVLLGAAARLRFRLAEFFDRPDRRTRADFDAFYPTSLLVTGFDILFFWVARMMMMGCRFAKDVPLPDGSSRRELKDSVPFREVYIHALVRDANREKMSKTKGNVIDPIEIVKQYGTDAVRFTLAAMASPGTDIAFNEAAPKATAPSPTKSGTPRASSS